MPIAIPPLPATATQAVQMPANVLDPTYYFFLAQLLKAITDRTTMLVKTGAPVAADVPQGEFRIIKNTTGPTYSLVVNDAGSLKSVALT